MTTASARRRPPGRYDEPSPVRQRVVAVAAGVLLVVLLTAVVTTLYTRYGDDDVRFRVIGFTTVSDSVVQVDVEVSRPADATAYCTVRARDAEGLETGREVVEVPPSGDGTVRLQHRLATEERAVTGEVEGCGLQAPPAPGNAP